MNHPRKRPFFGFTLVEVMMAAAVMLFSVVGALRIMQSAFYSLDAARGLNIATQILQSKVEKARMANWAVINALPTTTTVVPSDPAFSGESFVGNRFALNRTVIDVRTGVRDIIFTVQWSAYNGVSTTRTMRTRYVQNGLYDFFYSTN